MPDFIVTTTPWGLISRDPTERIELNGAGASAIVPGDGYPLLYTDAPQTPWFEDQPDSLERRSKLRSHDAGHGFFDMPAPLRAEMVQRLRKPAWRESATIGWSGLLSRPYGKDPEQDADDADVQHFQFLMALVGRIQNFDSALSEGKRFLPWETVFDRWLESESNQDPTMDVVVRHAMQHRARWADIVERPRRILNRTRELVGLNRVEELDTQCMAWLSRQPGRTMQERAGPRQRILALARYENLDTLENRVLRDLMERTEAAARDYLRQNRGRRIDRDAHGRTSRYRIVEQYARECRRFARELQATGVSRPDGVVQPNFVLIQDDRYRHVWSAWTEIVQRERVSDDLWRWQRRAWSEFAKAACGVALLAAHGGEIEVASPLFFRPEHRRGVWLEHDDPLIVVAFRKKGLVIEVLDGCSTNLAPALSELGASVWLQVSDLSGRPDKYVAVWTTLAMGARPALRPLLESADETAQFFQRTHPQAQLLGGIVLQAETNPTTPSNLDASGAVTGISFGPFDGHLSDGLTTLSEEILALVEEGL
ncbi:DUF2357 domain-containing protein [Minwuia thermotolerans]|uniref:DUF2357 domain-containing protein n=1 Tax=Minwuia thermotolerans TaxID=2056226 RepID=UPI000D6DC4D3|nr:DUF2357 domain-containing protein [Minwuia thermotolerans]